MKKFFKLAFFSLLLVFTAITGYASVKAYAHNYDSNDNVAYLDEYQDVNEYNYVKTSMKYLAVTGAVNTALAQTGFVGELWDGLKDTIESVIDFMVTLFEGSVKIFYTAPDATNNITGGLTIIGWLTLVGAGFALFWLGMRFIRGLIGRMRGR